MSSSKPEFPSEIILAVDGSEHFRAVVELLHDLPLSEETSITALAVISKRNAALSDALEVVLEQTQKTFHMQGIKVVTELKVGNPAETINLYADLKSPDLIALGAKGLRATFGILLGGVVQQVLEYSRWPVLIVRAPYAGLRRILLVTDGSVHSQLAVDYLIKFSLPVGSDVRVMHVLPPKPVPDLVTRSWPIGAEMVMPVPPPEIVEAAEKQAEGEEREGKEILDQTLETLEVAGIEADIVLTRGDSATEIIEYVKEHEIDLVVAGSRGLSQVKGWLLGSVSRKLVHYAGCSVLIVKGMPEAVD